MGLQVLLGCASMNSWVETPGHQKTNKQTNKTNTDKPIGEYDNITIAKSQKEELTMNFTRYLYI
jgi:hypothetical protein